MSADVVGITCGLCGAVWDKIHANEGVEHFPVWEKKRRTGFGLETDLMLGEETTSVRLDDSRSECPMHHTLLRYDGTCPRCYPR